MTKTEYNGWTNYETWNANLHYSDVFYDLAKDAVNNLDTEDEFFAEEFDFNSLVEDLGNTFEEMVWENEAIETMNDGLAKDAVTDAFRQIDWESIARTHLSDIEELQPFIGKV